MELQYQIEKKIGYLNEAIEIAKNDLDEYAAGDHPNISTLNSKHSYISKLRNQVEILEETLQGYKPEESDPKPIVPMIGIQERTPEENEKFHIQLITECVFKRTLKNSFSALAAIQRINRYFVCIASLQWVTGQIEKFEALETMLDEIHKSFVEVDRDFIDPPKNLVDSELTRLYAAQKELYTNCAILEQELGINEGN